jgi:hypothetical protein
MTGTLAGINDSLAGINDIPWTITVDSIDDLNCSKCYIGRVKLWSRDGRFVTVAPKAAREKQGQELRSDHNTLV